MTKIKIGSDFSGVGAFNQTLLRLGIDYEEVFACDMDKYARQTFELNYGLPKYFPKDVYEREIPNESLDIYMTSPPCQAFSLAGKRKGEDDKRGILFYNSHEFIQKNKPRYFIFENVKGLLSDDSGKTFQRWIDFLGGKSVNGNPVIFPHEESTPYHVYYQVLNAKHYGIPQNRERIFIIGIRDDEDNNFSFPKPFPLEKRLKDVLESEVDEKYFLSDIAIERILRKEYSEPKINPEIAGTINTKNNSPQCSFDSGTSLIEDNFLNPDGIGKSLRCSTGRSLTKKHSYDIINLGNVNPSGNGMNGNVFSENGVSPSLTTNKGEGIKIEVAAEVIQLNPSTESGGKQPFQQNRVYDTNGVMTTLDTDSGRKNVLIEDVKIGAIRGRNPQNPKSRQSGLETEQQLEINENGTSNALTTVQKDNVVVIQKTRNDCVTIKTDGTIGTLQAGGQSVSDKVPNVIKNQRIRRLTPLECFRLMDFNFGIPGVKDFVWDVSDSQAYKQAGNSICVGVLCEIIKKLNLK